jgi:hypothetical protein
MIHPVNRDFTEVKKSFNFQETPIWLFNQSINPISGSKLDTGAQGAPFKDIYEKDTTLPFNFSPAYKLSMGDKYARSFFNEKNRRESNEERYDKIGNAFSNVLIMSPARSALATPVSSRVSSAGMTGVSDLFMSPMTTIKLRSPPPSFKKNKGAGRPTNATKKAQEEGAKARAEAGIVSPVKTKGKGKAKGEASAKRAKSPEKSPTETAVAFRTRRKTAEAEKKKERSDKKITRVSVEDLGNIFGDTKL